MKTVKKSKPISVSMVSLGCPKNLVDSEIMLGLLKSSRYEISNRVDGSDVALINTCSFIEGSRQESVDYILKLAELKKKGLIKKLIICGCLPQKYHEGLAGIKEIDAMVGTGEYSKIDTVIQSAFKGEKTVQTGNVQSVYDHSAPRFLLTPSYFRYIKVGEGCDHRCSFCIIPELRGDYRSRSVDEIVGEVSRFAAEGMVEANLISQDSSYYGRDIDGNYLLSFLLEKLNGISGLEWIRLLYNHPVHMTDEIIDSIARLNKVCKYVDIPLQHISDPMLKSMKRGMNKEKTVALLEKMRKRIPRLAIRTTFIVGYPGETEADFKELAEFVSAFGFERLGVFTYSKGDDKAAAFEGHLPDEIKQERRDQLMEIQQSVSRSKNESLIGRTLDVLLEEKTPAGYRGRTEWDAPEIDCAVEVKHAGVLQTGKIYKVKIHAAQEYDLSGEIA